MIKAESKCSKHWRLF